jgi:hypothetical protein
MDETGALSKTVGDSDRCQGDEDLLYIAHVPLRREANRRASQRSTAAMSDTMGGDAYWASRPPPARLVVCRAYSA